MRGEPWLTVFWVYPPHNWGLLCEYQSGWLEGCFLCKVFGLQNLDFNCTPTDSNVDLPLSCQFLGVFWSVSSRHLSSHQRVFVGLMCSLWGKTNCSNFDIFKCKAGLFAYVRFCTRLRTKCAAVCGFWLAIQILINDELDRSGSSEISLWRAVWISFVRRTHQSVLNVRWPKEIPLYGWLAPRVFFFFFLPVFWFCTVLARANWHESLFRVLLLFFPFFLFDTGSRGTVGR